MSSNRGPKVVALLCLAFLAAGSHSADEPGQAVKYKDYDQAIFEVEKRDLLDPAADDRSREHAVREVLMRNAREAPELLRAALRDRTASVREQAAEYLAMLGDRDGLAVQLECLTAPSCSLRKHQAIRMLGNSKRSEYAAPIAAEVRRALDQGLNGQEWRGDEYGRAILKYGALALARIGRPEDKALVIRIAELLHAPDTLEALGYVDDPKAVEVLWAAYRSLLRKPTCRDGGLGVPALAPLSRLGDRRAIELLKDILRGVGTVEREWQSGTRLGLCADREQAFLVLRPRDAANFAETVFEVAAQEPEGPGSLEAWTALGLMRPAGYGDRVFKLAMSKKPHWKLVTRDILFNTVIAIDPSLNDAFWKEYGVNPIPTYSGQRALIEKGLGYLMFPGTMYWTGD